MSDDSSVITEQCILRAEIIVSEDRKKGQKKRKYRLFFSITDVTEKERDYEMQ